MESSLSTLIGFWWILPLLAVLVFWKWAVRILGVIIVPDDSIGLVTKKYVLFGKNRELPAGKIIALRGEAGLQADTLAPARRWPNRPSAPPSGLCRRMRIAGWCG